MKKFAVILGLFFLLNTETLAEYYHDIDVDLVCQNGDLGSKSDARKLIDSYLQRNITEDDENKTVVSNIIDNHYHNPEYIPIMEAKCQESMKLIKGKFSLWEEPNFRADMCLTWEINKKLTTEQVDTFAYLKKIWENVISDLIQGDDFKSSFSTSFDNTQEYSLQLAVRIYNLVLHQNWPECVFETGKIDENDSFYKEPCNEPSQIMISCKKSYDVKKCMEDKIVSEVAKFQSQKNNRVDEEEIKKRRSHDLDLLFNITKRFISQIFNDEATQEKNIIRLYNFYWLSILVSYKMNLDYMNID